MSVLVAGGVALPTPTKITSDDTIIWSSNFGMTANGNTVGDVIANKKSLDITWEMLPEDQVKTIKDNLSSGFLPLTFRDDGVNYTINMYRGTLRKEHMGYREGKYMYRSVTVSLTQQ